MLSYTRAYSQEETTNSRPRAYEVIDVVDGKPRHRAKRQVWPMVAPWSAENPNASEATK